MTKDATIHSTVCAIGYLQNIAKSSNCQVWQGFKLFNFLHLGYIEHQRK